MSIQKTKIKILSFDALTAMLADIGYPIDFIPDNQIIVLSMPEMKQCINILKQGNNAFEVTVIGV